MQTEAYLGLGSNLGDRGQWITGAVSALRVLASDVIMSSLYETRPQGFSGQPGFLNAVCRIWTRMSPFELLYAIQKVQKTGHRPVFPNGPRRLDVDLLMYGKHVIDLPHLVVPHPRLHEREFVLAPLTEIAPGLIHPVRKETVSGLLRRLVDKGTVMPGSTPQSWTRRFLRTNDSTGVTL